MRQSLFFQKELKTTEEGADVKKTASESKSFVVPFDWLKRYYPVTMNTKETHFLFTTCFITAAKLSTVKTTKKQVSPKSNWLKKYQIPMYTILGAPVFLTTAVMSPAVKQIGRIYFPKIEIFKPLTPDYMPAPSRWTRYDPLKLIYNTHLLTHRQLVCFTAPVLEEILFRNLMLSQLTKNAKACGFSEKNSRTLSIVITSIAYSAMHSPRLRVSALINGMIWGYLADKSGSILPSTVSHVINNRIAYGPRK